MRFQIIHYEYYYKGSFTKNLKTKIMQDYNNLIQQLKARKEELSLTQEQIADRMEAERVRVNELFSSKKNKYDR